jgi:hypothetical protein
MGSVSWEEFTNDPKYRRGGNYYVIHKDFDEMIAEFDKRYFNGKYYLLLRLQRHYRDESPTKSPVKLFKSIRDKFPEGAIKFYTMGDGKLIRELMSLGFKQDNFGSEDYVFVP